MRYFKNVNQIFMGPKGYNKVHKLGKLLLY